MFQVAESLALVKIRPFLAFVIGCLSITGAGCESAKKNGPVEAKEIEVELSIETTVLASENPAVSENRVILSGRTNLPVDTQLLFTLQDVLIKKNPSQSDTRVLAGGTFKSLPLGTKWPGPGFLDKGDYDIVVTVPLAFAQPKNVQRLIGDKGQMLTGPLVLDFDDQSRMDPETKARLATASKEVQDVRFGKFVQVKKRFSMP